MSTLKFNSLEISFKVSGSGPLLILHHGWGSRGSDWEQGGWPQALEKHATVLIFDAVGHGKSTLSHDPTDQTVEQRAAVVTALADDFGAEKFGFVGFSMGGRTGFELAAANPERLSLLAIGGMHLLPPSFGAEKIRRRIQVLRSGRAKFPDNDPLALAASNEALLQWQGAEGRLGNHTAPTLFFCGDEDLHFANASETARSMNFEFVALPSTDHRSTFFSSPQAVSSVAEFVSIHLA